MSTKDERTVGGFVFGTEEQTELARKDEEKIAYLEGRMDYTKLETVQVIYTKAIENRVFETPVGYSYLLGIHRFLKEQGVENVEAVFLNAPLPAAIEKKVQKKIEPSKAKKIKAKLVVSLFVNLILTVLIIAMFVITIKGNNPNILNYENALIDKYASWEQDLSEREVELKEKQRDIQQEAP